jgi:transcriptional regulator with XRE-family HTH domain
VQPVKIPSLSQKRPDRSYETSRRVQRAFGARLKSVREAKGELQKLLGDQLCLSRTSVSNIERGTHRVFLDQAYTAAHALGVEISELLPPVSEVFAEIAVHTASDDPLPASAADNAREIARSIQLGGLIDARPVRPQKRRLGMRRK